jgi:hypothetical protein
MTGQKGKGYTDPPKYLGKVPAQEQDMPGLRERMAIRVEEEHRKLVEEELIYQKRQYRMRTPSPIIKKVRYKGDLIEYFPAEEAGPDDQDLELPRDDNDTGPTDSASTRKEVDKDHVQDPLLSSGGEEEPLTQKQEYFVSMGKYPDKYPVQKGGEPDRIMVTRSGNSRSKYLMPGGLAMGCTLNYVWHEPSRTVKRSLLPHNSRVDEHDAKYEEAAELEWCLRVTETAAGVTEFVQVPYDGGNKRNRDDGAPKSDEEVMATDARTGDGRWSAAKEKYTFNWKRLGSVADVKRSGLP